MDHIRVYSLHALLLEADGDDGILVMAFKAKTKPKDLYIEYFYNLITRGKVWYLEEPQEF